MVHSADLRLLFKKFLADIGISAGNISWISTLVTAHDMPSNEKGMPVESVDSRMINECVLIDSVQSRIFDFVFAIIGKFGLRVFQNPTGSDKES